MIQRPNFAFYQDPNNDITYYSPEQSNALENQWLSSPEGVAYAAQNARQTQISADPLYQAITRGISGVVNGQEGYSPWDQGNIEALYNQVKAGGTGLDANSDWTGLMQNMQNRQFGQFGNWSHDSAQVVPKFWDYNGLDPNRTQINNYLSGADYREKQGLDDWRNAMGEATPTGGLLGAPDMFYKFAAAAASMGAAGMAGAGAGTATTGAGAGGSYAGLDAGMGAYDMAGASAAVGGSGSGWAGNTLGDASWGVNARDGGGMYDNLYGDSADLIDAYGGNQSTIGNVDEFGNNIYGGQQGLNSPDMPSYGPDFGGDPLGGTNNAPIPAEGIQKLVDAGVPWEIASKMNISSLKSLMSMAQSKGGGAGGNNPWAGLLAAGLGVLGSRQQTNSLNNLSQQFANYGAPSRARYESSYQPGFTMANDPGFTDALNLTGKAAAHAQSVGGNPTGSANAQTQINKDIFSQFAYPALQNYRNQNSSTGGFGSFNTAAPSAGMAAVQSQGNMYNALGAGINDIFNPKPTLAQSMADYQRLSQAF